MSEQIIGYRFKPSWIKILAILLILAPLGNIAVSFISVGVPNLLDLGAWTYWIRFVKPEVWALNFMLLLSGISLLWVRTRTHSLAAVSIGAVLIYNIVSFQDTVFIGPIAIGVSLVVSLIALAILYHRDFRKPYFNPRLRWWETSTSYRVDLPVELTSSESGTTIPAVLLDVSRSGLLVKVADDISWRLGESQKVQLPKSIHLNAKIVRKHSDHSFGLSFEKPNWKDGQSLKNFIRQLETDPRNFLR